MEKRTFEPIDNWTEALATAAIGSAYKVYTTLGPGLLETVYEDCLCHEFVKQKIAFQRQVMVPIVYDGISMGDGFRLDLLLENSLIIELKSVVDMNPVYQAQLLTYLKLTGKRLGLLINFNVSNFNRAVRRVIL